MFPDLSAAMQGPPPTSQRRPEPEQTMAMGEDPAPPQPGPQPPPPQPYDSGQVAAGSRTWGSLSLLAALAGGAFGAMKYGARGGAAGFLLTGSATNIARAARMQDKSNPAAREEALWSGVSAVAGLAIGGWLVYKIATEQA